MRWPVLLLAALALLAVPPASAQAVTITVELVDQGCPDPAQHFCMIPNHLVVDTGDNLVLRVTNLGHVKHNLTFGPGTPAALAKHGMEQTLDVNETVTIEIPWSDLETALGDDEVATFVVQCGLEGHALLGETGTLQVGDAEAAERPQGWVGVGALIGVLAVAAWVGRRR